MGSRGRRRPGRRTRRRSARGVGRRRRAARARRRRSSPRMARGGTCVRARTRVASLEGHQTARVVASRPPPRPRSTNDAREPRATSRRTYRDAPSGDEGGASRGREGGTSRRQGEPGTAVVVEPCLGGISRHPAVPSEQSSVRRFSRFSTTTTTLHASSARRTPTGASPLVPPLATMSARVSGLTIYPVKSCSGVHVDAAVLTETGLRFDRAWMVVEDRPKKPSSARRGRRRAKPRASMFLSQRVEPRLALVTATLPPRFSTRRGTASTFPGRRAHRLRPDHAPKPHHPLAPSAPSPPPRRRVGVDRRRRRRGRRRRRVVHRISRPTRAPRAMARRRRTPRRRGPRPG